MRRRQAVLVSRAPVLAGTLISALLSAPAGAGSASPPGDALAHGRASGWISARAGFEGGAGGANPAALPSYDSIVRSRIEPTVEQLLIRLNREGRDFKLDGVPVFAGDDKFLPGKIALALAEYLVDLPKDDPRRAEYLQDFRRIAKLTVDDPDDTWGIYYYLDGLNRLRKAGVLTQAVDRLTLAKLRVRLDWRNFVDVDSFELIDHPNNYYGVAFVIARLRVQMGWEDPSGSERLLSRMLEHYRQYSGAFGFADETDGEGRFDRYSILLSAEVAQHFLETGSKPPPEVVGWVRKSAQTMLVRANPEGYGFEYGRSLGPYGETAAVEVLTAAAVLGVLSEPEKALSYAYIVRIAKRYADFWLNPKTGSLDMWDQGRRTDKYRGKFRILGENLSLVHQFLYTAGVWNDLGYHDKPPMADFEKALEQLPQRTVTWFARGQYDRMLLTLRDHGHVIGLPLINGGSSQHMHSPYYPIPFSQGMLAGIADSSAPLLIPRFALADGSQLSALAYFQDVKVNTAGKRTVVTYRQHELDRLGDREPHPDERLAVESTYTFTPGRITRTDVYQPKAPLELRGMSLEFATYSSEPVQKGSTFSFGQGALRSFTASGFESCSVRPTQGAEDYQTPIGPYVTLVSCSSGARTLSKPFTMSWTLTYQ